MAKLEIESCDGVALAERVRRGEASAAEVLEAALARLAALNPALNAVVRPMAEEARRAVAAGLADGPFTGVPMLLKDLLTSHEGVPTAAGSRFLAGSAPAPADSELVRRYKRAGAVIIGKSNTSEFGLAPAAEPALFGPTRNPWNLDLSPGGSSGGSAAAVAAGIVPLAHATDGGGSIRIPASSCGLFGLKPTRGRNSMAPFLAESLAGSSAEHVVSRSVRDSAAMLDATQGWVAGDPYAAPPLGESCLAAAARDPGPLRIAFADKSALGAALHPDCAAAVEHAALLCEALGHAVEPAAPEFDMAAVIAAFTTMMAVNLRATLIARGRALGREAAPDLVETLTWAVAERGAAASGADYVLAVQILQREARRFAAFFERYDVFLTATLASPPVPTGSFAGTTADVDGFFAKTFAFAPWTMPYNVSGQPAMSVPLHWSEAGLPIGVQFGGRFGAEATLFRLAGQLERARPWAHRRPPTAA